MSGKTSLRTNKPLSITVITKLVTPNAGNQAISTELIRLLRNSHPGARLYSGWRESGLEQYSFSKLQHDGPNPLRTLDNWAEDIIRKYRSSGQANSQEREESPPVLQAFELSKDRNDTAGIVELVPEKSPSLPSRAYNKALRTLKMPFDRRRGYGKGYEDWLTVLEHSDWVIFSPAGVMGDMTRQTGTPGNFVLRDLLCLLIAHKLGARVTAANQSIEINHPLLLRLLGHVYGKLDSVVVRDHLSARLLTELQVPPERITLAPDTAFLSQPAPMDEGELNEIREREKIGPGTVGITAIHRGDIDLSGWGKVIQQLQAMGKQVLFVSNQMYDDVRIASRFQKLYGVRVLSRQYDYNEYIRVLSLLELVVSERYHTCVFSTIANKPFIPLNLLKKRKMPGLVSLLNYPVSAVDSTRTDWQDTTIDNVHYIYEHYDKITADLLTSALRMTNLAKQNAVWNGNLD